MEKIIPFTITEDEEREVVRKLYQINKEGEIKKEGIIYTCNEEKIKHIIFNSEILESKKELLHLRNCYVYVISSMMEIMHKVEEYDSLEKYNNLLQVITSVIDKYIMEGN